MSEKGQSKEAQNSADDETTENTEKDAETKNPAHKLAQTDGEIGGPSGLEPTRYGDWERKGIISDF